ncbi:MAG: DUF1653 domain-containing protein [Planctomycetaceae bacterium]|jgi:hypothetical protein|nr:DUF1653 domain-containing protein [Planctomycetaceae bacterium]MBT4013418.1 DUF1653 domain-containing protein [Planctomycetaceae bacterium]MBT4726138.1 DUF1653 domain-containing protein [Planctomycetaceae bacterium]MBT4844030.1 DUF1653 domain-containing protein [Planctomycetaceae bacterium]MBT5123573.1 DUF1653 domain-containing protein [Planctomycetaceae bacterium]
MESDEIQLGRYRHYKRKEYTVLGIARHSETDEMMVLYRPEYGERNLWVRPQTMFFEDVTVSGTSIPRFEYLGPAESEEK